jgi:hypothetical protein
VAEGKRVEYDIKAAVALVLYSLDTSWSHDLVGVLQGLADRDHNLLVMTLATHEQRKTRMDGQKI